MYCSIYPLHSLFWAGNFLLTYLALRGVSDITYMPTDEGWLYLAGIKDLFNGELVGYAMNKRMTKSLIMQDYLMQLQVNIRIRG